MDHCKMKEIIYILYVKLYSWNYIVGKNDRYVIIYILYRTIFIHCGEEPQC